MTEKRHDVRALLYTRLRTLPRKLDTLLNTTVLFGTDTQADLSALEAGLAPRTPRVDESAEKAIVERILAAYHVAKADQKSVPPAYKPGGEWGDLIRVTRREYLSALERRDAVELSQLLRNVFRNSGVVGLLTLGSYAETAAASNRRKRWFVHCILQDYATWKELTGNTNPRSLAVPTIGNAWGYVIDGQLVMSDLCRLNYFAHQARALLSDVPGVPVVAEIGGGFGGFAYYLLSASRQCRYVAFDLPEILLVQQYYLMSAFPRKKFLLYGEQQIKFDSALASYDVILLPNFGLPKLPDDSVDFFINTESLSEIDYATIEDYIAQIARTCRLYFFHDNSDRATPKGGGHIEVPSSRFPIPESAFKRIYKSKSPWVGPGDRMREHLYRRLFPPINS